MIRILERKGRVNFSTPKEVRRHDQSDHWAKETTPLYDLFEKFPDISRTTIIKLDVLNWGVRYTPVLNWIGRWTLPLGTMGYSTFPEEVKSGEVSRSPQEANLFDIPSFMILRDGTNIQMLIKPDAPYEIRYEGGGSYLLYWNGMAAEKLARAGLHGLQYNIEVWDKKMFYVTCPGKAKNITWGRWTKWLAEAVPYFEKGHVISNQVLGLELQPPEGYYTDLERGKGDQFQGPL